jgi:hypothetical protein
MSVGVERQFQLRLRDLATRCAEPCMNFRPMEGVGNAGCSLHPQPRVQNRSEHTSVVTTGTPVHPAFPHAMVLTAYFVLSPVIGLVCHRRLRSCLRKLGAGVEASGPHDFAVREVALSSAAPPASIASRALRP